jgi:23S rRNA G2445 N2-methylase RlmL
LRNHNPKETITYYASCSNGLLDLLLDEVEQKRLTILSSNRNGVYFTGNKEDVSEFLLSTRISSRVSILLLEAYTSSYDDLYFHSMKLPWEDIISVGNTFSIEAAGANDRLANSEYAIHKLKDSIKDRFRKCEMEPPDVERRNPDVCILLKISDEKFQISLSVSGTSLTKRGYRHDTVEAPIRENLAQSLLVFSGWKDEPIIDLFCGSGTILIEAALFQKWNKRIQYPVLKNSIIYKKLFKQQNHTLYPNSVNGVKKFYGYDIDKHSIERAKENAERAGVLDMIEFTQADFREVKNPFPNQCVYVISNPPYGERLGTKEEARQVHTDLGKSMKSNFSNSKFSIVTGDTSLLGFLKLKEDKSLKISIAKLKGKLVNYTIL